jgi:pilus assembly protein CpaB
MGATVRRSVPQGELITQDDVLYPGNPGFLAAVLSPGKRAVSIPTSAVSSNSGLVSAGDWVDVILTLKRETAEAMADQEDKTSGMTKLAAQTILTNVRVLALNNSTESIAPQPETAPQKTDAKKTASTAARRVDYRTITLEVTPTEAQALAVAKEAGDLQVSIRGLREPETKDAAGTSAVNEKTAAVTHLQDATGILGTQRPAAKTVITYQGAAVAPVTF